MIGAATLTVPGVSFSNVVRSASLGATSFQINFQQVYSIPSLPSLLSSVLFTILLSLTSFHLTYNFLQPVASLNANHLQLTVASSGASVSLSGSIFTSLSGGSVWTVSKTSGFYTANTYPTPSLFLLLFLLFPFSFSVSVSSVLSSLLFSLWNGSVWTAIKTYVFHPAMIPSLPLQFLLSPLLVVSELPSYTLSAV